MKKPFAIFLLAVILQLLPQSFALANDIRGGTIYQIVTDRFFNGDKTNDDPAKSKGMFDSSRKNWHVYWGGDLAGIRAKLKYIHGMGFDTIWISPVVDNADKPADLGYGLVFTPYHGYHARDFGEIDEHFGDWQDFDGLVEDAHKLDIKVLVDMSFNHTNTASKGEFGAFYRGKQFLGDFKSDKQKFFHHLPLIKDWNDPYQVQYYTVLWLSDLNHESPIIHNYLVESALKLKRHGADGTRLDAAKHVPWGWLQALSNSLADRSEHFVVAEWWMLDSTDPLYKDAIKFVNKAGIAMFDFPYATAVRKILGSKKSESFELLARAIEQEYEDLSDCNSLVTFIDNHDMPRFLSLNDNNNKLNLALALLFTSRGIPCFYYGTEQNLHDDTKGGGDPYTRVWMGSFREDSDGYKLVAKLNKIRNSNIALRLGRQKTIFVSSNCYVYERVLGDARAIVAINKGAKPVELQVSEFDNLPNGVYEDKLGEMLFGTSLEKGDKKSVVLKPGSASIWSISENNSKPVIASIAPSVLHKGATVSIYGTAFGTQKGKLFIGEDSFPVLNWSDSKVTFSVPGAVSGIQNVVVNTSSGKRSNPQPLSILKNKLIPVTFVVKGVSVDPELEKLYITGDGASLGDWSQDENRCAGPMLYTDDGEYILTTPMPKSTEVKLKLIVKDKNGKTLREQKRKHIYKLEDKGPVRHELTW